MICHTEGQKQYLIGKGYPGYTIQVLRYSEIEAYLSRQLAIMPSVGSVQLEFYFGSEFNWWWYGEDGRLHPNDFDHPSSFPDYEDEDIPF